MPYSAMCRFISTLFTTACFVLILNRIAVADHPAPIVIPESEAKSEAAMQPYAELIEHTDAKIEMVPIRGGRFIMGSPESEKGRYPDEGPQHEVEILPFWMARCEITWDAYEVWMSDPTFSSGRLRASRRTTATGWQTSSSSRSRRGPTPT